MKAMDKNLVDALSNTAIESAQAMRRFAKQIGDLPTTYGAIRRRRLLALKLMRSTEPPLLYSTCYSQYGLISTKL